MISDVMVVEGDVLVREHLSYEASILNPEVINRSRIFHKQICLTQEFQPHAVLCLSPVGTALSSMKTGYDPSLQVAKLKKVS